MGQEITSGIPRAVKKYLFHFGSLTFLYIVTRMLLVMKYPIFNDEAIYIRYGQIMMDPSERYYSLGTIGKQPLIYWLYGAVSSIVRDPLIGSRIISVMFGAFTLWGIIVLTKKTFGDKTAFIAGLLYVLAPLSLFFDTLAVVDNALSALFIWFTIGLSGIADRFRWSVLGGIGVLIGLSLWVKTTGLLFLFIALFVFFLKFIRKKLTLRDFLQRSIVLVAVIQAVILPMLLRPEIVNLFRFQSDYALTISEIFRFPVRAWSDNLVNLFLVLLFYISPVVVVASFVLAMVRREKPIRFISSVFLLSILLLVVTGRALHGRYVLFSTVPLFVLSAPVLSGRKVLYAAAFVPMALLSGLLILNPVGFFHVFPQWKVLAGEAWQYVDGWPSGYGVMEALSFVDDHRSGQQAFVGVRWDSGNPEDTVLVFGSKIPGVTVSFFDHKLDDVSDTIERNRHKPMYLVTRNDQRGGLDRNLTLLARFAKPAGLESVEVYQFRP